MSSIAYIIYRRGRSADEGPGRQQREADANVREQDQSPAHSSPGRPRPGPGPGGRSDDHAQAPGECADRPAGPHRGRPEAGSRPEGLRQHRGPSPDGPPYPQPGGPGEGNCRRTKAGRSGIAGSVSRRDGAGPDMRDLRMDGRRPCEETTMFKWMALAALALAVAEMTLG